MTDTPPPLFDDTARLWATQRARAMGPDGGFLRREVAARLDDRLLDINRDFTNRIDLGGNLEDARYKAVPVAPVLDLSESSVDLVVSNLALHSVNDLVGTLIQAGRALKPDGFLLASLFGGETLHELRHALLEAEVEVTGGAAQRVHPMGDVRDLGGLLSRAGLALPVADVDRLTVTYEHPLKLLADLRAMGEVNTLADRSRKPLRRSVLMRACDIYQNRHAGADGRIPATFDVIYLSAWRPDASQQKPAKRGSGTMSLTEALKPGVTPPQKT